MKPVFQEQTLAKLKDIIDSTISGSSEMDQVDDVIQQVEIALKAYKDNQENKILYYGTSLVVVVLSLVLTYTTKASWPLMFLILWVGGFMYYRVHEKSLVNDNLIKSSLVKHDQPLTSIAFLKSAIDLKTGRKNVLKIFLSILISCSVMMAHFLFVDSSFWMNFGLLVGAIVASYFFWQSFYKEDIAELGGMKDQLSALENQLILGSAMN